jgi:hypothetical protein
VNGAFGLFIDSWLVVQKRSGGRVLIRFCICAAVKLGRNHFIEHKSLLAVFLL